MLSHPLSAGVDSSANSGAQGAALPWDVSCSTRAETTDSGEPPPRAGRAPEDKRGSRHLYPC